MPRGGRLLQLNPLRLLQTEFSYQKVPAWSAGADSTSNSPGGSRRTWSPPRRWTTRHSATKALRLLVASAVVVTLLVGIVVHSIRHPWWATRHEQHFHWHDFARLDGFYNGIRTLVKPEDYQAQNGYNVSAPKLVKQTGLSKMPPLAPIEYSPYQELLAKYNDIAQCYLNEDEGVSVPQVYAYPGLPQHFPQPFFGSYSELGLRDDVCFDRYGRYGAYGYGYDENMKGHGLRTKPKDEAFRYLAGKEQEQTGSEKIFEQFDKINWTDMDWGASQRRCFEKNEARFGDQKAATAGVVKRHAYVLRTWTGFKYDQHHVLALRAMITELSLKSGAEYDVHLLVHVKDNSLPIWAEESIYNKTLRDAVPKEFWGISTLWSEQQMKMYYPGPFAENFAGLADDTIHGAYRSPHFALQWFSRQHPEYDFFWNWEMDVRYSGHYYELNSKISDWARKQPRKGLWERSQRFWIPQYHGNYDSFTKTVEAEIEMADRSISEAKRSGPVPIWGPVQNFRNYGMLSSPANTTPPSSYAGDDYGWGVGEEADLITFDPLFDPSTTNWVFRQDTTGYNITLPLPPRRAAIVTVARLSRRLLDTMHSEVTLMKHTMFPEMWPASVCLHHGLKAVYAPHPVYFDHDWNLEKLDQISNRPIRPEASVFGWGEHNLLGSSFYYNSGLAGVVWRRWLGMQWLGEGGKRWEESGTGRMCLRSMLVHPVKYETGDRD